MPIAYGIIQPSLARAAVQAKIMRDCTLAGFFNTKEKHPGVLPGCINQGGESMYFIVEEA
jgi:hypothetical protein